MYFDRKGVLLGNHYSLEALYVDSKKSLQGNKNQSFDHFYLFVAFRIPLA